MNAINELTNEVSTEQYQVWVDGALWEDFGHRKTEAQDLAIKLRSRGYRAYAKTLRY